MRQRNRPIAPAESTASPGLTPTAIVIGHKAQADKLSIASSPVALPPEEICHAAANELLTVPSAAGSAGALLRFDRRRRSHPCRGRSTRKQRIFLASLRRAKRIWAWSRRRCRTTGSGASLARQATGPAGAKMRRPRKVITLSTLRLLQSDFFYNYLIYIALYLETKMLKAR